MLILDATHTSHTRAQTGIQRVTRSLFAELKKLQPTTAVCHDPYLGAWRPLDPSELDHLRPDKTSAGSRRAKWPLPLRIAGHVQRLLFSKPAPPAGDALICPEIFSPATAVHLPQLLTAVRGPRVAVFHDAIALRFPELTPAATVARFPNFLRELLLFDGIAANSAESRDSLLGYWQWLGVTHAPPVVAIPLGVDVPAGPVAHPARECTPIVLCVSTLEGRKNHTALLEACEQLWTTGHRFELHLIGHANTATGGTALRRIRELQAAGRPLRYDGPVTDEALESAYASCAFTVYPSVTEGFGLPVIESLARGRPCVCSARGAIGESARGGGCLMLDTVYASSLAAALARLLASPDELASLSVTARARKFKTWSDYLCELQAWMRSLPRR